MEVLPATKMTTLPAKSKSKSKQDVMELPPLHADPASTCAAAAVAKDITPEEVKLAMKSAISVYMESLKHVRQHKDPEGVAAMQKGLTKLRLAEKTIDKYMRLHKSKRKRAVSIDAATGLKKPTGFNKPQPVSAKLAQFLGISEDQHISRVEVTRKLCAYIRQENLQNAENKREFYPDANLASLLDHDPKSPLTYYNLQSKIQKHMLRAQPAALATN